MADTNKVSLAHLKMAMNTIKEYHDQNGANFSLAYDSGTGVLKLMHGAQEISSVTISSTASSPVPCTGITLNTNTLSFTSTAAQTITATKQPSNTTDVVTWSVTPTDIVTVDGGVVTPVANGSCTITVTCGSHSATCAVTVSGLTVSTALYELAEAKTFNGTSDYLDTGVTLLSEGNLSKDWTILIDFTPTSLSQCSIIHCMTESSPWPGMYLSLTATGDVQMVFPNGSTKNNIVTVTAGERVKFVIKKVGNTFTLYDSSMSSLHTATTSAITTTDNTLLVGAIQIYNTTHHTMTYSRYFTGTVHKFKIVEGDMSSSDCLNWMA